MRECKSGFRLFAYFFERSGSFDSSASSGFPELISPLGFLGKGTIQKGSHSKLEI